MLKANVNVFPKDGFWFREADGTIIRADSGWKGLVARVVAYRRRNKLPAGDPAAEVNAQACARSPGNCQEDSDPVYAAAIKVASLKGRVLAWLAALRVRKARGPLDFVPEELMRARARVCASCPAHATVAGGCGSCKKALRAVREDILGSKPIADVQGCSVLDEDCAVNAWLADITVENGELPGCCWRRRSPPS